MDDITRYMNFVKKYNEELKKKGTNWLNSEELGKVLLDTAQENNSKSKNASQTFLKEQTSECKKIKK